MKRYVLVLTAILIPGALHAQETEPAWKGLNRSALATVFVLDNAGVETRGQLLRLDPDAVVLLVNGAERRFETERVARVSKRGDSLKNGAINGLIVGIAQVVAVVATQDCQGCNKGVVAAYLAANTVSYVAIGTLIDAAIQGRTVLYKAPTRQTAIQPRGGATVSVRLTW